MGGKKEGQRPSRKLKKTDEANTDKSHPLEGSSHKSIPSKANAAKAVSLEAILSGIQADAKKWPQEAFKAVLQRFNRMPRGGWNLAHETFRQKFQASMSLLDFKKKAREAIVSKNGKP